MADLSKVRQFIEALEHSSSEVDDSFIVTDPESAFGGETNGAECTASTNRGDCTNTPDCASSSNDGNCKNTGECSSSTNGGKCENKALEEDKKSTLPSF